MPRNISRPYMHFLLKLFGAKLHPQSYIYGTARVYYPANLVMERMATIGPETDIYNVDTITLRENAIVSQKSYLCTASHSTEVVDGPLITAPIVIEKDAWVAADAFIGMGVTIGEGAVVGARAAVFKDVEPWTIVGGNPAKFIKQRELKQ